ncbi:MAG TPA: hypothetical protein VH475_25275 [Tepidisphaeraceae bacterium]|jgi:hypothetical protein
MNPASASRLRSFALRSAAPLLLVIPAGCGAPDAANITLRKENQNLRDQIETLGRAREADAATIRSLQAKVGTLPTLPEDRLDKLFTTHGLQLGRLTGGADLDATKPGDEGVKVYATPTDDEGQPFKAAGSFVIEAYDLAENPPQQIGKWSFDVDAAKKAWIGSFLARNYVFTLPWQQRPPRHDELTVKVTFHDELTGREFHDQKVVKVKIPPATQPGTTASR